MRFRFLFKQLSEIGPRMYDAFSWRDNHAGSLYGAAACSLLRTVQRIYRFVRTCYRSVGRRAEMIVISIVTLLIFVYLAYALIYPEKF
ncbi:hypothetical protein CF651_24220 [Paenibacillus rigui]|uniref:K(+)-transporting ATPase subunit F n=1 Tax=Paenibacillus rigui TaxID=554312 RepID=A0A229UJY6_9BACL|nr:hypothetical protein CF651_24220 [Paenibacillus rigui]